MCCFFFGLECDNNWKDWFIVSSNMLHSLDNTPLKINVFHIKWGSKHWFLVLYEGLHPPKKTTTTPLKINMEDNHGGLVRIIFLSKKTRWFVGSSLGGVIFNSAFAGWSWKTSSSIYIPDEPVVDPFFFEWLTFHVWCMFIYLPTLIILCHWKHTKM